MARQTMSFEEFVKTREDRGTYYLYANELRITPPSHDEHRLWSIPLGDKKKTFSTLGNAEARLYAMAISDDIISDRSEDSMSFAAFQASRRGPVQHVKEHWKMPGVKYAGDEGGYLYCDDKYCVVISEKHANTTYNVPPSDEHHLLLVNAEQELYRIVTGEDASPKLSAETKLEVEVVLKFGKSVRNVTLRYDNSITEKIERAIEERQDALRYLAEIRDLAVNYADAFDELGIRPTLVNLVNALNRVLN